MIGAHQNLNGLCDQNILILGTIWDPYAGTCYGQLAYQIWSVWDYLQQRYERQRKNM